MAQDEIKAKYRILYIHPVSGTGGALVALVRLLRNMDKTRFHVKVICPDKGASYDLLTDLGYDVTVNTGIKTYNHHVCGWYSIRSAHRVIIGFINILISAFFTYKIVRREKPHLVHLGSAVLLGPALGARVARAPIVWHIREPLADGYLGIRKKMIASYIDFLSDKVIAIRYSEAERLKQSEKLTVIYDCVDFAEFDRRSQVKALGEQLKITNDQDKIIATFGSIIHYKGSSQFVQAAIHILKNHDNIRFFMFGPIHRPSKETFSGKLKWKIGPLFYRKHYGYVDRIEKLISEEGRGDKIILAGDRRDVVQVMLGVDLVVSPYTLPHSTLPIMEAGAMAKPVVASNLHGISELVIDGVTGVLVPPGDSEALAKAIIETVDCPEKAQRMGAAGYRRAKELFNACKNTAQIAALYDEMLRQRFS